MEDAIIQNIATIVVSGISICTLTPLIIRNINAKKQMKLFKNENTITIKKRDFESIYGSSYEENFLDINLEDLFAEFIASFKEKYPYISLNNFDRNVETTIIKKISEAGCIKKFFLKLEKKQEDLGYCDFDTETVVSVANKNVFFHELIHLASTYTSNDLSISGFYQVTTKNNLKSFIGRGLNEGYTEYLTSVLLNGENVFEDSPYLLQTYAAARLSQIVGFKKMTLAYFDGNLYDIKECITNYIDENEFIAFIRYIDGIEDILESNQSSYMKEKKNIDSFFDNLEKIKKEKSFNDHSL